MPQHDFKKERQGVRLARVWRENKGNWLLATGLIVSLLAWAVGYFDLIPTITASSSGARPTVPGFMATGNTLIVHVTGCESDEGQVVAMLYAGKSFNKASTPLRVELLPIEEGEASWQIHNLPFGSYAVVAFHDANFDEVLQAGIERQGPIGRSGKGPGGKALSYSDLVFPFTTDGEEILIQLE
jgi:hypothetical protein